MQITPLPPPTRTLSEVAAILGVSKQTVAETEKRALRKLRKRLRGYSPDVDAEDRYQQLRRWKEIAK